MASLKKIFKYFLPSEKNKDYLLQRKTEYTFVFLSLLTPYILATIALKLITVGVETKELFFNLFFIVLLPVIFLLLKKGKINLTINLMILLGNLKAFELMLRLNDIQFFVHMFLVLIAAGAVHTRKYQLITVYVFAILLFGGKIFINLGYLSHGYITINVMHQIYQAVYTGIIFILSLNFITKIIYREITLSCELEKQANTDSLTGAYNRRKFSESTAGIPECNKKAFCMIDIDHFKEINDKWGHETGDRVLSELSRMIKEALRTGDIFYRWGGEEFLIIIYCTDISEARIIVERIRLSIGEKKFLNNTISVTFSAGISMIQENDDFMDPVRRADIALYKAKNQGRNRIVAE